MANLKVGSDACARVDVLDALFSGSTTSQLPVHWKTVAQRLQVPDVEITAIEKKYNRDNTPMREVYDEILVLWIGIKQDYAILSTLIEALEKVAGNLRKRFGVTANSESASGPGAAAAAIAVAAAAAKKSSSTLSKDMEDKLLNHIKKNTDSLVRNTSVGVTLVAKLESAGFLHDDEVEELNATRTSIEKSRFLYGLMKKKLEAYDTLIQALRDTCQQKPADILSEVYN